jgi:hypothetical protein
VHGSYGTRLHDRRNRNLHRSRNQEATDCFVTYDLGQRPPTSLVVRLDVGDEALVLLLGLGVLVGVRLLTAREPLLVTWWWSGEWYEEREKRGRASLGGCWLCTSE